MAGEISQQELNRMFRGKPVRITYMVNRKLRKGSGTCRAFHIRGHGAYDLELEEGGWWRIIPEEVTATYIEGPVGPNVPGRRRIEIIESS